MTRALVLLAALGCLVVLAAPLLAHVVDEAHYAQFWRDREAARQQP